MIRIGNTRIRVRIWLWLLVPLALLLDSLRPLLWTLGVLVLHEIGHALAALAVGLQVEEIELAPYGGMARVESALETMPGKEAFVALCGPGVNMLLALGAVFVDRYFPWKTQDLALFVQVNLSLALFNLLPALPLDGGRVLRALLCKRWGLLRATAVCAWLGVAAGIGLVLLGAVSVLHGPLCLPPCIAGAYLAVFAWREKKSAKQIFLRELTGRREAFFKDGALPVEMWAAGEQTPLNRLAVRFRPRRLHRIWVLNDSMQPVGVLEEQDIYKAYMNHREKESLGNILAFSMLKDGRFH